MWILLLVSSIIAVPEEWLVKSSIPTEYSLPASQAISQSEIKNDELIMQKPYSKRLRSKSAKTRASRTIK